jgi:hypothetical protein
MQGATLSSSPRPHHSGSASSEACFVLFGICLVLPYTRPGAVPSFAFGIVPSGAVTFPSSPLPTASWSIQPALLNLSVLPKH